MCQYSVLNVCRESHAWNANYSTTLSKYVIGLASLNKYMGRYNDYWHSKCVTLRIHSTHDIGAFDILPSLYYVFFY